MTGAILIAGGCDELRAALGQALGAFGPIVFHDGRAGPDPMGEWTAFVEGAGAEHGRVRGVVNVLDLARTPRAPIDAVDPAAFDGAFLSTIGQGFAAVKAAVPAIAASGGGFFLTILERRSDDEDGVLEPMATGGLTMMTRAVAVEYAAPPSTRVNLILRDRDRLGAEAVTGLARYLCGPDSAYVTGAVLGQARTGGTL